MFLHKDLGKLHRRGPNSNKRSRDSMLAPGPAPQQRNGSAQFQPSLTNHLVAQSQQAFSLATQQPFLSHAGCGTLSVGPLAQWMVQDGHYTRGYIQFLGAMISKIRLPDVANSQFHPMYRTLDLLISALNNIRREMSFFEITATKYGIQLSSDPPSHITRAYIDMFNSVSNASSSLLEGMVVLWATEHVSFVVYLGLRTPLIGFHSATVPPGCTLPHSHRLFQVQPMRTTSPPFIKHSFPTGHRQHSPNSSTHAERLSTSLLTLAQPQMAKKK